MGIRKNQTEDIKFPKQIEFLREITITSSLVMFIVYMIVGLLIGGDQVDKFFGDKSLVTFSLLQGVLFGAGLTILLQGVRMMLSEIIPAFKRDFR